MKIVLFKLALMLGAVTAGHAAVISLADVTEESITLALSEPGTVLECPAGTSLHFTLALGGDTLALDVSADTQMTLRVLKTCYISLSDGTFFLSSDGNTWEEFQNFFTGELNITLGVVEGTPSINVSLEHQQRS